MKRGVGFVLGFLFLCASIFPAAAAEQAETRSPRMSEHLTPVSETSEISETQEEKTALSTLLSSEQPARIQADDGSIVLTWEGYSAELVRYQTTEYNTASPDINLYFEVANHTDQVLDLWFEDVTVNGVKVLGTGIYDTEPGEETEDFLMILARSSNKEECSEAIRNAQVIQGTFVLEDSDTGEQLLLQEVTIDLSSLEGEQKDYRTSASVDTAPAPTSSPAPADTETTLVYTEPSPSYRTLQQGATGEDVRALQEKLVELGYLNDTPDGSFGPKTAQAVKDFNEANGLDGGSTADFLTQDLAFSGLANRYTEPWVPLQIGANFQWESMPDVNTFYFRVQVTNHSRTRAIKGYELYYYYTDIWGNKLDNGVTYSWSMTQRVGPGETLYSGNVSLGNWFSVDTVWVGISKIVFEDGEIRENDAIDYYSCVIPTRITQ